MELVNIKIMEAMRSEILFCFGDVDSKTYHYVNNRFSDVWEELSGVCCLQHGYFHNLMQNRYSGLYTVIKDIVEGK